MFRVARVTLVAVTVLVSAPAARIRAESWPRTIVGVVSAAVYANPDASAAVTHHVPEGGVVRVRSDNGTWADVLMYSPSLGGGRGWMRSQDLVRSEGLRQYWREQFENAVALLTVETRGERDPVVAAWKRFHLGYAQWATGDLAAARATFEALGRQRGNLYAPYAWLAAAKIALVHDDTATAIAEYQGLTLNVPGFQLPGDCSGIDTTSMHWPDGASICRGNPSLVRRTDALRAYAITKADLDRVVADRRTTPIQRAEARLAFARALEQREDADPVQDPTSDSGPTGALHAFEAVVEEAPGSAPAGFAAWKVIQASGGEWEGDWHGEAAWLFEKYGQFLADYPQHELVPDAKLKIAEATWADGGYVELFHLVIDPGGWEVIEKREAFLEQWFDTRGVGGGALDPITLHPEEAVKAQQMFRDIVAGWPASRAAAMAQDWVAVIFDYCLGQPATALPEYETFLRRYPTTDPFVDKARGRIAAIRAGG